jgi:hypothetical protein
MNFQSLNLIWNWKELIWLEKEKWHCCIGLRQQWHSPPGQGSGPARFGLLDHKVAELGRAPGFTGWLWLDKSRQLLALRCSGEGSGSKLVGRRTEFGGGGEEGLTRWAWPRWSGSTAGEKQRQARVEVIRAVGTVVEELPSSEKVAAMEPCPEEGRSGLALMRPVGSHKMPISCANISSKCMK